MDIQNKYCINCGADYRYQASGEPSSVYGRNREYCPECDSAIKSSLSKIEKKTKLIWKDAKDEMSLDNLFKGLHPHWKILGLRQVYPETYREDLKEHSESGEIRKDGITYYYSYFPSDKENAVIKKKVRINIETGQVIDYK